MNSVPPTYSAVIPVYNSAGTLAELCHRLTSVLDELGSPYEIILVDDGSTDESWETIEQLRQRHPSLTGVTLTKNFGQHNALMCGLGLSAGRYVVTLDDDLQHPPEEIPKLLRALEDNQVDVVYAKYESKRHGFFRNMGSFAVKSMARYAVRIPDGFYMSSFRAMTREMVNSLVEHRAPTPRIDIIVFTITDRVMNVATRHDERKEGRSGYSLRRLIKATADDVINYSSLPLRVVSTFGFVVSLVSLLLAVYYLTLYSLGKIGVSGFTTLVLLVLFFGGATLATLGIVGEYLIRIIRASERRPTYVIRNRVGPRTEQRVRGSSSPAGPGDDSGNVEQA